jgi:hypothetical protein
LNHRVLAVVAEVVEAEVVRLPTGQRRISSREVVDENGVPWQRGRTLGHGWGPSW